jgi:hypothetical protein
MNPATNPAQPPLALSRSWPPHAGVPEGSTWSTRSAASMNDVDPDKGRQTMASEEGHNPPTLDISNIYPATITCIMSMCGCAEMSAFHPVKEGGAAC